MDVFVLAGGRTTPDDPLYAVFPEKPKALLPLLGKPMLQWVLDALNASRQAERVFIFGDDLETVYPWAIQKPVRFLPDAGSMIANIRRGLRMLLDEGRRDAFALLVSGDVPTVSGAILDWVAENAMQVGGHLIYHVVERSTMESRFPGVRRTYVKLRDVEVCGADINVVHTALAQRDDDLWDRLYEARKSPFKQARLLGWDLVLGLLFHRFTLEEAMERVKRRLRVEGTVVVSPYPEIAMDVDKPQHIPFVETYLRTYRNAA